jgi:uncharacterized membrane protein (UPF0127 family)
LHEHDKAQITKVTPKTISFTLKGTRKPGRYSLIHIGTGRRGRDWLLIKKPDEPGGAIQIKPIDAANQQDAMEQAKESAVKANKKDVCPKCSRTLGGCCKFAVSDGTDWFHPWCLKKKDREKQAQAADPAWMADFIKRLWLRENAGRTGYDPAKKVWTPYKDMNKGKALRAAIGPGVVVPKGTTYTQPQMSNAVNQAVREHWGTAQRLYPGLATKSPHTQQLMTDITYAGAGADKAGKPAYPKLWSAINARNGTEAAKQYHMNYTPPGGVKTRNVRRNTMNLKDYVTPMTNSWAQLQKDSTDHLTLNKILTAAGKLTEKNPSPEQAEAGNYAKGKVNLHGFEISIENPKGSTRSGVSADGKEWSTHMYAHYGYIKRTESEADGDHVDVFIGPYPGCTMVFVIDQVDPKTGTFDECKCMLGYRSDSEAREGYLANYDKGWQGLKDCTALSMGEFKEWLDSGSTGRACAKQFKKFAYGPAPAAQIKTAAESGWHGVDLDGTLATYDGWKGDEYIGRPIKKMVDRIKRWRANGENVKIMTTRGGNGDQAKKVVEDWCLAHLGEKFEVTNEKDHLMIDLWDDRAHRVQKNTGVKQAGLFTRDPTPEPVRVPDPAWTYQGVWNDNPQAWLDTWDQFYATLRDAGYKDMVPDDFGNYYITKAEGDAAADPANWEAWDHEDSGAIVPLSNMMRDVTPEQLADLLARGREWERGTRKSYQQQLSARLTAKQAKVTLDIEKGDTLLFGRYKNKPHVVEEMGTDEKGQPTVNGMKLLACRIKKKMPAKKAQARAAVIVDKGVADGEPVAEVDDNDGITTYYSKRRGKPEDAQVWSREEAEQAKKASMVKEVPLKLVTPEGKERAKFRAEMADTPDTRRKGLSKRAELPADTGMLFDIPGPFWMKDVNFPLDIVYLDKQGTIIEIGHMPEPPRYVPDGLMPHYQSGSAATTSALEMPAGWADRAKAAPGDRVEIDTDGTSAVH